MFQAAQQRVVALEGQLHALAADFAQLAAQQTRAQSSAQSEQPAAADSALKQRLRKVELTVAGKHCCLKHSILAEEYGSCL